MPSINDWEYETWGGVIALTFLVLGSALAMTCMLTEPTGCYAYAESWRHSKNDSEEVKARYERCVEDRARTTAE